MSQELAGGNPDDKNWKGIGIASFVIASILGCVGVAVVVLTPEEGDGGGGGLPFDVRAVLDPRFKPRRFNGSWLSDGEIVFRDSSEGLSLLDAETMKQTQIVGNTTFVSILPTSSSLLLLVHPQ